MNGLRTASQFAIFLYLSIKSVWEHRHLGARDFLRQVLMQVYFTAVQAMDTVVILATAIGALAVVTAAGGLGALSGEDNLGRTVTVVVLREVAPLLTGGIVIVRSVTAIAAELGVMRVQREIEALEVMGIPPLRQLVAPRIFGGLLSFFGLNVLFDAVALVGGYAVAQFFTPVQASVFFGSALAATTRADLVAFWIKVVPGGICVFAIACYRGLDVGSSSTEIPVAVSKAALNALVLLVLLHAAVSVGALLLTTHDSVSLIGGFLR